MENRDLPLGGVAPARSGMRRLARLLVIPGLVVVFATDSLTPLGLAHGLLYAPILLLAIAARDQRLLHVSLALAVLFIGLGAVTSPPQPASIPLWLTTGNRILSIVVVLSIGALGGMILRRFTGLEDALRELGESRALLEMAGSTGRLGGWAVPLPAQRVIWSAEVSRLHGIPPGEEVTVEQAIAFYHPEDRDTILREFERCVTEGVPFESDFRIIPRGADRPLWIRTIGRAVRDHEGRIVAVEGAFQDINRLKLAEQSLEESDRRLRLLADAMPIPVWTATAAGVVDFSNRVLVEYTGAPREHIAANWLEFLHPDDREEALSVWARSVDAATSYLTEFRLLRADGEYRWHLVQALPIRDANGGVMKWYGTAMDLHERRALEQQARELASRLEATLESITDAFFTLDRDWRFVFLNHRAEQLLHRQRADLLGRLVWDEFPAAVGSNFQRQYEHAMRTGESVTFEEYFPPLECWFSVSAYPSAQGLAVYFRDITAARQRDEQLRLLEAAVSRLNDLVVITQAEPIDDPGPTIVYVNEAFERRTGYTRGEVLGQTPRILQGPGTQRDALDRIRAALRQWKPIREELLNYTKAGAEFWVEIDIVPIADATGWYTHWVAVERDVTERKRAEEALRTSQERLTLILNSIGEGVHGIDEKGRILFQNPAAEAMFGNAGRPVTGADSHALIHHHRADGSPYPAADCPALQTLRDGIPRRVDGEVFFRHDGTSFPVEYSCSPMRNAHGELTGSVIIFRDVTRQRALEEQLRQSQRLESVGKLTGGMAHDFNNLLTVIQGNAELLAEELESTPALKSFAVMIHKAAQRGSDLTHRLLAFARRQPLDPKPVDVNRLAADIEPLLRRALGEQIEIQLIRAAGLWEAMIDRSQFESALLNLAINSRDAMPAGGRLTIETSNATLDIDYTSQCVDVAPGSYILVAVSDTGTGMTPETMARVFEPFFTTKSPGKGTGLGLSMVYGFIKQSRGHIRLYSEVGVGTTIKLYLPRASRNAPLVREVTPLPTPASPGHAVILLVEDDELVRTYAESQLQSLGYSVIVAENGPAALAIIRQPPPIDLLFTDIVMPGGMNGRELADAARQIRPGLRVLYTSGYTDNAIVHHGRLDPGALLLSKPYGRAELARKIREVLDSQP